MAGNIGLAQATANALGVLEFVGRPDVPLAEGSAGPLLRPHVDARDVHGDSGLGQARLPPAQARPVDADATDLIIDTIGAAPGEITLVATGPLTNIALAVRRRPELVSQVADFVIMGGSATRGNTTPAAEFNIATDPEAAAIVFGAGWQVTMVGLDATLQARADGAVRDRLAGLGRLGSDLLLPALGGYAGADDTTPRQLIPAVLAQGKGSGPAVHDVCALALVAEPGLFGGQPARVEVETVWPVDGGHDRHRVRDPGRGTQCARRHLHRGARILGRGDRRVGPRPRRTAGWMTPSPGAAMAAYDPPGGLLTPYALLGGQPEDGAAACTPETGRGRRRTLNF